MRKPYMTGAKPEEMPNEPKMYPGDESLNRPPGGKMNKNLDGFAEDAQIKAPEQLKHVSSPIESEHIFGKPKAEAKQLHVDTKLNQAHQMPKFANKTKKPKI